MNEFYNKHYIRLSDTMVVKGFSDAFESPLETDICINEQGGRHFEIGGVINPPLYDMSGCHLYRYDGSLRKATDEELEAELADTYVEPQLSQLDIIEAQVTYTALMTDTLLEG